MTLDPITIERIRELHRKGVPKLQIAKKLGVSLNSVNKYTRDIDYDEQHTDERKGIKESSDFDKLEEELTLAWLKPEIHEKLCVAIGFLDDIEELSNEDEARLNMLNHLLVMLEESHDIKKVEWIKDKHDDIIQQIYEAMEKEANKAREEKEQQEKIAREKYNRQYNMLKHELADVIKNANELLPYPLTSEETDEITKKMLPYGRDIYYLAQPSYLTYYLRSYGISKDKAKIISTWWRKRIYRNA